MNKSIKSLSIGYDRPVSEALKQMDEIGRKLLIVIRGSLYHSMLSIGDIQRAIINGIPLSSPLSSILRREVKVGYSTDDIETIKKQMLERRNEFMPIVSADGNILKVVFWEDIVETTLSHEKEKIDLPVLVMAGGVGSRLKPLTNVLPKALIPIGDKSIIEQIMDSFIPYGCNRFFLSVNYKAEMIKYYLSSLQNDLYHVNYIQETSPLGTAGSIKMLEGSINSTFFVTNCDIMVDQDYAEILKFHKLNDNEITIVAAMMNVSIPYGVLNTNADGLLISMDEKPEFYYKINTGLYILEPTIFRDIPPNTCFHITELIDSLVSSGRRVGVFPVSESSWIDMGNWDEFLKKAKIGAK